MAKQVRLQFISDGFREILLSDGVKSLVEENAKKIQEKANSGIDGQSEGFLANVWQGQYGGGRWIGSVTTTDFESQKAEAENKVLSKAVKS